MKYYILLAVLINSALSAKFPSNIKRCSRKDANFDECLLSAIKQTIAGLTVPNRELGLFGLEPLEIPSLVIGAGTGAVLLAQNYSDVKLYNYSKLRLDKAKLDFDKNTLYMEGLFTELVWQSKYKVSGKVLLLPVFGDGPCQLSLDNCKASETFNFKIVEKKGKKHFMVENFKMTLDPERAHFRFDNLFNGEKALGDNINTVINDNWKEVFDDVKDGYANAIGDINAKLLNNVLSKFSIDELFG